MRSKKKKPGSMVASKSLDSMTANLIIVMSFALLILIISTQIAPSKTTQQSQVGMIEIEEITNRWTISDAHNPIIITSDYFFGTNASSEGWDGDGSESDPYVIENYEINQGVGEGHCISISNTRAYFIIRDCYFQGADNTLLYSSGIYLYNTTNGFVTDNYFEGNANGVSLIRSNSSTIVNNTCDSNDHAGIMLNGTQDNTCFNNTCTNNGWHGFYIETSKFCNVDENTCTSNTRDGVALINDCWNNTITDNNCDSNGRHGIGLHQTCYNHTISNNTCVGEASDGIFLDNSDNNEVYNNTCSWNTNGDGIHLESSDLNTLHNNTCNTNLADSTHGILLLNSNNNTVTDNICSDNRDHGIYFWTSHHNEARNNTCNVNRDYDGIVLFSANHTVIVDNTCTGNNRDGVSLYSTCYHTVIANNTCNSNDVGINVFQSAYNTLENNTCNSNTNYGIDVRSSDYNTLRNNTCISNADGIIIIDSDYNAVDDNTCNSNTDVYGIYLGTTFYNTITNNTCNFNTYDGIRLWNSFFTKVINNICSENGWCGIYLQDADSNTILNNTLDHSVQFDGIILHNTYNNTLANNTCIYNNRDGIFLEQGSDHNRFFNNTCNHNANIGIFAAGAVGNDYNNMTGNILGNNSNADAADVGSFNIFDYNYYADYTGVDDDGDGIGDTAYSIAGGSNTDTHPMMSPTWIVDPADQIREYGAEFTYQLHALSVWDVDQWWLNDTSYFSISQEGIITNHTVIPVGTYGLQVWINDTLSHALNGNVTITVTDTIYPEWTETPTDVIIVVEQTIHHDLNATDLSGIHLWWLNDTVNFSIDGNGMITNETILPEGVYGLQVWVNDTHGLTISASFDIIIDLTSPEWVETPTDQYVGDMAVYYDLDATDISGIHSWWLNDTVNFNIDGNGVITNITILTDGILGLQVWVNDTYGNVLTASFDIVIDLVAPEWVDVPSDQLIGTTQFVIYDLDATDPYGIHSWWLNDTVNFDIDENGVITNITILAEGTYGLQVCVNDTYNNILNATFNIFVDSTPPDWVEVPTNQLTPYHLMFYYDLNASDPTGLGSWWLNDTTNFSIDSNGVVTNKTILMSGSYGLQIWVSNTLDNHRSAIITITVGDIISPVWDEVPEDRASVYEGVFNYDLNATDHSGLASWWLNDTARFAVSSEGIVTTIVVLPVGHYGVQVYVNDTYGNVLTGSFTLFVVRDPPSWLETPENQVVEFGHEFRYPLMAFAPEGIDSWWLNDTTYFMIDSFGVITNTTPLDVASYAVQVSVSDTWGQMLSISLTIEVVDTTAPSLTPVTDPILEEGADFGIQLIASDLSGISYWEVTDTDRFAITSVGYLFNITSLDAGVYNLIITVFDIYYNTATVSFKVTVFAASPPSWVEVPTDKTTELGDPFAYDLDAFDESGIDEWVISDTTSFIIDQDGTITNATQLSVGTYTLEVWVSDTVGNVLSSSFTVEVEDTTAPTWINPPQNQVLHYGDPVEISLEASDLSGVDRFTVNDTECFGVTNDNNLINIVSLESGVYVLNITVYDHYDNPRSAIITITVAYGGYTSESILPMFLIIGGGGLGVLIVIVVLVKVKQSRTSPSQGG